jgi:ADP-heptose:LPS heptosyltransferase
MAQNHCPHCWLPAVIEQLPYLHYNASDFEQDLLTIDEQTDVTPEAYLERLQAFFARSNATTSNDALKALQASVDDTPLTNLIGSAPSSFTTPEEADQFIRQERDAWDY